MLLHPNPTEIILLPNMHSNLAQIMCFWAVATLILGSSLLLEIFTYSSPPSQLPSTNTFNPATLIQFAGSSVESAQILSYQTKPVKLVQSQFPSLYDFPIIPPLPSPIVDPPPLGPCIRNHIYYTNSLRSFSKIWMALSPFHQTEDMGTIEILSLKWCSAI